MEQAARAASAITPAHDTIAAIATPPGHGGIGVVRVSGPQIETIASGVLGRCPPPRRAAVWRFRDAHGEVIDEGLAIRFVAPHSYTGEHTLELHGHGGPAVLQALLARVLELGARPARPGEFTERAFRNGRLDLAQAEGVADLIAARSAAAARGAVRALSGEFSRRVDALAAAALELRALVEASLDFPDDDLDVIATADVQHRLTSLHDDVDALLRQARHGVRLAQGTTIVIAGAPNAGKSTLLNALLGEDRAIVTPIAGTTRDVLRAELEIDGVALELVDTAGLQQTADVVEREGVARARREIEQAEWVLAVIDATSPPTGSIAASIGLAADDPRVIAVHNKVDLLPAPRHFGALRPIGTSPAVAISAADGAGLDALRELLRERACGLASGEGAFTARQRHLVALADTAAALRRGLAPTAIAAPELLAEELHAAHRALAAITGRVTADDLLGEIFARFCIGK